MLAVIAAIGGSAFVDGMFVRVISFMNGFGEVARVVFADRLAFAGDWVKEDRKLAILEVVLGVAA